MTPEEVVLEVNNLLETADPQTEDNLSFLAQVIANIFRIKCGVIPNFEIVNSKGQIKLVKPEFYK